MTRPGQGPNPSLIKGVQHNVRMMVRNSSLLFLLLESGV